MAENESQEEASPREEVDMLTPARKALLPWALRTWRLDFVWPTAEGRDGRRVREGGCLERSLDEAHAEHQGLQVAGEIT